MKFNIGDKAIDTTTESEGIIVRAWDGNGGREWLLECNGVNLWVKEEHLKLLATKMQLACSCGARFTSRPGFHLDWCDSNSGGK